MVLKRTSDFQSQHYNQKEIFTRRYRQSLLAIMSTVKSFESFKLQVKILDEPASTLFAMRFSGYTMDFLNVLQLQELRSHLNEAEEEYVTSDPFAIEVYDK